MEDLKNGKPWAIIVEDTMEIYWRHKTTFGSSWSHVWIPDRYTNVICIQCVATVDGPESQSLAS